MILRQEDGLKVVYSMDYFLKLLPHDFLFEEVFMAEKFISRGFKGRARETDKAIKERIPPGQFVTTDFPVLSAGPTPRTPLERWDFSVYGEINEDLKWTWNEFQKLPRETVKVDIHCVTKWLK